jgi:hypothetical protein
MFFRTKAITSSPKRSIMPEVEVITTLECPSCNLKRVRDFQRGDYVFKDDEPCTRCEGKMVITGIHRRPDEKSKR